MKVSLNTVLPFKGKNNVDKVEFLRERYTREEQAKDEKDTGVNIPYFLRVESKINEVKNAGMVESEYNRYKSGLRAEGVGLAGAQDRRPVKREQTRKEV